MNATLTPTSEISLHMKHFKLLFILLFPFLLPAQVNKITGPRYGKFIENRLLLKVKEAYRQSCSKSEIAVPAVKEILNRSGAHSLAKRFPDHHSPATARNERGEKLVDLSLIYQLQFSDAVSLEKLSSLLMRTGVFQYAEPEFVPEVLYVPNDPAAVVSVQYYLNNIKAFEGWDVSKGDTNMVVGITDTGTDPAHPDLQNIKHNYLDPIDGIDNDLDGYVDNFSGWDLGENDNNPTYNANAHGVHVSGLASAATDNAVGMAGIGFKCKYLPIKIADANGSLTAAYDGIVYAADHGCKVINCSWGGSGGGLFGQDIVDYAVFNRDALVISAAGNDNRLVNFFPASYKHVLNVAATDSLDKKASFSNYSCMVDVTAPGADIYSTWVSNGYLYSGGTSMAAPITAGAAAIVRTRFPGYTALQTLEQLKVTSDSIYHLNTLYIDFLGRGRINLYRALTETGKPSIDLEDHHISDNGNNVFSSGDTLSLMAVIKNYLAPSQNLTLILRSLSPYVQVTDSISQLSPLLTFQRDSNSVDPFRFLILSNAPTNALIRLKIIITDGSYANAFCIEENVNVDYINVQVNDISTTITSRGRIGYNSTNQVSGLGFVLNDQSNLLYEAGLMLGNSTTKVSDAVRGDTPGLADRDFASIQNVREVIPAVYSEYDLRGVMNDDSAGISRLNIKITQNTYVWSSPGHTRYIMLRYSLYNPGNIPIVNLYPGIFTDWDIQDAARNRGAYDAPNKMGYTYNTSTGGLYAGVKLLSRQETPHCYSIDNVNGGAGGIDPSNGFSSSEKYTALSTDRYQAGILGSGTDVLQVVSVGPLVILPGDSIHVGFAMIGGESLADLQSSAFNAQLKYDEVFPINVNEIQKGSFRIGPNPVSSSHVYFQSASEGVRLIRIYDGSGRLAIQQEMPSVLSGSVSVSELPAGLYTLELMGDKESSRQKLIILTQE